MLRNIILFIFVTIILECSSFVSSDNSLKLVHVLFRHGDRTLDKDPYYNDPYFNETYYPYGRAQLTNDGKAREYNIGVVLRNRYDNFLGKIYQTELVHALTTNLSRTIASLELVMSGLFPPAGEQIWNKQFLWQPTVFNLAGYPETTLSSAYCPTIEPVYEEYLQSPGVLGKLKTNQDVLDYLTEQTGESITTFSGINRIYDILKTEEEFGLKLPEWTEKVYPQPLQNLAYQHYFNRMGTQKLKKYAGGFFLDKILSDSELKLNEDERLNNTKMLIYSAHQENVANILGILDILKPHIPPYGSYVLFELHTIDGVDGLKIFYQDYSTNEPVLQQIPKCSEFCSLEDIKLFYDEILPRDDDLCV